MHGQWRELSLAKRSGLLFRVPTDRTRGHYNLPRHVYLEVHRRLVRGIDVVRRNALRQLDGSTDRVWNEPPITCRQNSASESVQRSLITYVSIPARSGDTILSRAYSNKALLLRIPL